MSRISNVVIRVRRMIKVDKVGKNEQILNVVSKVHRMIKVDRVVKIAKIFKCCEQSAQNDQSGQGG